MKERIYMASPTMHGEEQKFVQEAFDTNWIAPLGKNVNEFEKELAAYVGAKDAAALSAGSAALHLALKASGGEIIRSRGRRYRDMSFADFCCNSESSRLRKRQDRIRGF